MGITRRWNNSKAWINNGHAIPACVIIVSFHYFTSTTSFGMLPLNFDFASAPILSATGGVKIYYTTEVYDTFYLHLFHTLRIILINRVNFHFLCRHIQHIAEFFIIDFAIYRIFTHKA